MILLANGDVFDGLGHPRRRASVLIRDSEIEAVGSIPASADMEVVDCTGLAVAPGFIDVHSHSDLEVIEHRPEKILQGVTSEVEGNCGYSLFPALPDGPLAPVFNLFERRGSRVWHGADDYFRQIESAGTRVNVAALTGHGTLRAGVLGILAVEADREALEIMKGRVGECLKQGATGMSTGLNEVPGAYAAREELVELARVVGRNGGIYTSHLRDYKFNVLQAVSEALELGRRAEVPVQLSHLQVVGRKNWDKMDAVLELVEKARDSGVDAAMDAYPYLAGSCQLTQVLPAWALDRGTSALLARLADSDRRRSIAEEAEAGLANGWDQILVAYAPATEEAGGQTIADIATARGRSGVETALDLLLENNGSVWIVSFNQSEENLRKVLTHPLTSIITDGFWTPGRPHPRTFGTYPTWLGEYVRDRCWLTLEEGVHKATGLPARRFKLRRRGLIQPGFFADVTVFDPAAIGTRATYLDPARRPEGIVHVIVNGKWAVHSGTLQPVFAGRAIRLGGA